MEAGEEFRREVLRLAGPEVQTCIQCGTCSASCPTAHLMKPSIRRLIKFCLDGRKEEALHNSFGGVPSGLSTGRGAIDGNGPGAGSQRKDPPGN
ncbi:MAG: hypothetical protein NTW84_07470 [Methanothrix sp.]|nr:hypothetical protein [Methanothrix sp.]